MPSQSSGNGSQIVGDDRTRLLALRRPGSDCGRLYCDLRQFGLEHGHRDDGLRHPVFMRPADETAVIPVTPTPQPIDGGEPYNDHPWCRKRLAAMAVLFGAGVVAGVALGFLGAVVLFAWAVS